MDKGTSYSQFFDIVEVVQDIKKYLPSFNEERFMRAFNFAEEAHRGQLRKDQKTPYISHPVEVVKILVEMHADEDTLISALLHDVPEDTEKTIKDVKKEFGDKIAFLVDGITKLAKVRYRHDMPERQVESLKKLLIHSVEDIRVILIKLCDRLHNLRTLENIPTEEKQLRIAKETLEIYVPIANLLGLRDLKSKLEDLCFKYVHREDYKMLKQKMEEGQRHNEKNLLLMMKTLKDLFKDSNLDGEILEREKNLYSSYKKIRSLGKTIDIFEHRIGIKILVQKREQCYLALGLIHLNFTPKTDRFRDYIANPKSNGYQSLHTTVFGPAGMLAEIQIRTCEMDLQAEFGVAAEFFSTGKEADRSKKFQLSSWIARISQLSKGKNSREFLENLKLDVFQDRIFVFTPKGTALDLPKGATVIDMAYAIHSDIGNHAEQAEVNGILRPISSVLKNRDVVKIISSKSATPEISWLSFAKTNLAKNKILAYCKKISKEKKIKAGHKLLQKEFDIAGLGLCEDINFRKLRQIVEKQVGIQIKSIEDLFIAIGEGSVSALDVVKGISKAYRHAESFVKGEDKSQINAYKFYLKIVAKNRFGLLRDIAEVLYRNVSDMHSLKGWASKYQEDAYFTTEIEVDDLRTIGKIFDELERIEGVFYVYRVSKGGLFFIYGLSIMAILLWIFNGSILRFISHKTDNKILLNFLTYGVVILMIALVISVTQVVKKYFPVFRNKNLLWIFSFSVPAVAVIALGLDIIFFDLQLSFLAIALEILFVYIYLYWQYKHYLKFKQKI